MKITITKTYNEDDIENIISVMLESLYPYFMLDNTTDTWKKVRESLDKEATIEEITRVIFASGWHIKIIDLEDDTDYYMIIYKYGEKYYMLSYRIRPWNYSWKIEM